MKRCAFGLWYGSVYLGEWLLPEDPTDDDVRRYAIDWHNRVPLCFGTGYNPREWRNMLSIAEVTKYECK